MDIEPNDRSLRSLADCKQSAPFRASAEGELVTSRTEEKAKRKPEALPRTSFWGHSTKMQPIFLVKYSPVVNVK